MYRSRRSHNLPDWLWFFLILPIVLIVALLYRRRRLPLPRLPKLPQVPGLGERGVQRYVEPDSIPLDMGETRRVSVDADFIPAVEQFAAQQEAAPAEPARPEDLKVVEGIGPSIERLLHDNGILRYQDLADAPVERLAEILTAARLNRLADPATWPEQARLAAEGHWEELKAYQNTLKGGRRQ